MKKVLVLISILTISFSLNAQNIDQRTKNQAKAKFMAAENYYDSGNYNDVLIKVEEIETLLNGYILPSFQNLKIKALVKQGKFSEASKALYVLEGLELDDEIMEDMASYSEAISKGIEREKALSEAYKYIKYEKCNECSDGKVYYEEEKTCPTCKGKGYFTKEWLGRMEKEYCADRLEPGECSGSGTIKIEKSKTCTYCDGNTKIGKYYGSYNFSHSEIKDYIRRNITKIEKFNANKN
jgi:RNA polymerase subunit RPABC4/transcription elongation factor Spt4